jgi:hypothetical protein
MMRVLQGTRKSRCSSYLTFPVDAFMPKLHWSKEQCQKRV